MCKNQCRSFVQIKILDDFKLQLMNQCVKNKIFIIFPMNRWIQSNEVVSMFILSMVDYRVITLPSMKMLKSNQFIKLLIKKYLA